MTLRTQMIVTSDWPWSSTGITSHRKHLMSHVVLISWIQSAEWKPGLTVQELGEVSILNKLQIIYGHGLLYQQTRDIIRVLSQCWTNIIDSDTTSIRNWANTICLVFKTGNSFL